MRKKVEREPDLIEFKVNYTLDEDLPVEKYFMAYNSTEALKAFAQSCVKFLDEKKLPDVELNCFLNSSLYCFFSACEIGCNIFVP